MEYTRECLKELLEQSSQKVYVIERDTYILLYANAAARSGMNAQPQPGQPCYAYTRGYSQPCPHCVASQMNDHDVLETKWLDTSRNKTYAVKAVPLEFCNKKAYVFYVDDVTAHIDMKLAIEKEKEKARRSQKREKDNFQASLQALLATNPNALCSFQLNLSRNICDDGHGVSTFILRMLQSDKPDGLFKNILAIIPDQEQRRQAAKIFDRSNLLSSFARGHHTLRLDYQRLNEHGQRIWVRTHVKMLKNPESHDIIGVFSSLDISKEKRQEQIFDIFTSEAYDYVAIIHIRSRKIEFLNLSYKLLPKYHVVFGQPGKFYDFDQSRQFAADTWVAPEDRGYYLQASTIEVVQQELDAKGYYALSIRGHYTGHPEEMMCRKIQHYYLDDSRDTILVVQSDVSQTYQQQQKLNEQQNRLMEQSVIDTIGSLPAASVLYSVRPDNSLIPLRYSDEFCHLKGCTQETIQTFNSQDGFAPVHPDDRKPLRENLISGMGIPSKHFIYRIRTADRGYIWVSVAFRLFQFGGRRYGYAVYTDIDDLKKQEQRIEEQYNSAQAFMDSVSHSYIATQRANLTRNTVEAVNGTTPLPSVAVCQDYDNSVQNLIVAMPNRRDQQECRAFFSRTNLMGAYEQGQRSLMKEYQYTDMDGNILWARCRINLTKRPVSGDVILFSSVSDITPEKLTETVIDRVISMQYDYLACLDARRNLIVLFVSRADNVSMEYIHTGMDYELNMQQYNEKYLYPADCEACTEFMSLAHVQQTLDQNKRCLLSVTMMDKGELRFKQIEFFYVDKASHLIGLVRADYTEAQKKQMEQETALQAALAAAQKANQAKSDFLSSMSHDIRTPLNGIIGMTYLTKELDLPPAVRENLDKIDTSSKFLLSLINDVLDMAKAESGKIKLNLEPYRVEEFQQYLQAVIAPLCKSKQQQFVADVQAVTTIVPLMDKLRINQIFFNLLSNAIKYTPSGGRIAYSLREHLTEEGRLSMRCCITDTGIGMSEEFQKILFQPFTQEERDIPVENKGTGLGLAIVKRLLDLMEGTITVKSELGKGSSFCFQMEFDCLPLSDMEQTDIPNKMKGLASLQGKRILLCEDHPLNQEIAKMILQEKGLFVDIAVNGKDGVGRFNSSARGFYDAILMDIRMPVMNGYEAARQIRALPRPDGSTVPIIAMTADAFAEDVQKALSAGMNGHIAKPVDPDALFAALMKVLA